MTKLTEQQVEVFNYLNELRESGATNMFGASLYVQDEFMLDKSEARKLVTEWMANFNDEGYSVDMELKV